MVQGNPLNQLLATVRASDHRASFSFVCYVSSTHDAQLNVAAQCPSSFCVSAVHLLTRSFPHVMDVVSQYFAAISSPTEADAPAVITGAGDAAAAAVEPETVIRAIIDTKVCSRPSTRARRRRRRKELFLCPFL